MPNDPETDPQQQSTTSPELNLTDEISLNMGFPAVWGSTFITGRILAQLLLTLRQANVLNAQQVEKILADAEAGIDHMDAESAAQPHNEPLKQACASARRQLEQTREFLK
jgi:hypothetical protein